MVTYHCDANIILVCPFASHKDKLRMQAYDTIMLRLKEHGLLVDLHILDNEASACENMARMLRAQNILFEF